MCDYCDIKPGEERFGSTFAPTLCWTKTKRIQNGMLQLFFGYGEDPHDEIWMRLDYCPYCGEKQNIIPAAK